MNGWQFMATMRAHVGEWFGLQLEDAMVGFYISATNVAELIWNVDSSPTGGGEPVAAVTGGTLDIAVRLDCDRPAATPAATLDYFIGGVKVGTRVVGLTATAGGFSFDYPAFWPGSLGSSSRRLGACARFYRTAGAACGGLAMSGWDNDSAAAIGTWPETGGGTDYGLYFAIRPPTGPPPARHPSGVELIARLSQSGTSSSPIAPVAGLFRRHRPTEPWLPVLALPGWQQTTIGGARYSATWLHYAGGHAVHLLSLLSHDLGASFSGALPTWLDQYYGPALLAGDETDPVGDNLPLSGLHAGGADRIGLAVVPHQRDGLEQIYAVAGLPRSPKPKYVVADSLRTGNDDGCRHYPFVARRSDGRFVVGALLDGQYRSWTSLDSAGRAWAEDEAQSLGAEAHLVAPCFCAARSGLQGLLGYHPGDALFRLFQRRGFDQPWSEPVTVAAASVAAAPYLTARRDGGFEAGWYVAGQWHRYLAEDLLNWTEVSP